ncbi:MAG: type II secretion system F family protein [Candidatus Omnitrophota bacterium]
MPRFSYTAKTKDSKTIKDIEDAASREEIIAKLKARGLFIISVNETVAAKEKSFTSFFIFKQKGKRSSIKLYDMSFLARNLATTLSSGVTLLRSLEILSSQTESIKLGKILKECSQSIKEGLSFKEAIAKYPSVFSPLWRAIVEVGEASGNLPTVLDRLADYLDIRIEFERKIVGALIYPAILMFAMVIAIFIFFKFILPRFSVIFKEFGITLPLPTQVIFSIADFVDKNFLLVIGGSIGLVVFIIFYMKNPQTKETRDRIGLKLPIFGELIFLFCLDRFTSTIYILLDSGLPLVYALEISARGIGNTVIEKNVLFIKNRVKDGASLSREFSKLNIFPVLIAEMAKIGEETGSMPEIFKKISAHYSKELTTRVERMIVAFEPMMILIMGVLIGAVVISLFLPLFQIATGGAAL